MNITEQAHALANSIKESNEYKEYIEAKILASESPELTDMLNDFQGKQFELQKKQLLGEDLGPEVMEQIKSLYEILMRDPIAAQYVQAEMRFTLMVNEIYTILGEVIKSEN